MDEDTASKNMDNNRTTAGPAVLFHEPWDTIYNFSATTFLVMGIVLNSITICLYYRGRIARSNFHYSLNIMSIVNIVQQLSFVPFIVFERRIEYPSKSLIVSVQCAFSYAIHAFFNTCFVNIYLICFLTVQRYIIIKRPLERLTFTNRRCRNYVICVAIFISLTSTPNLFFFYTDENGLCQLSDILSYQFSQSFAFLLVISGLIIPMVVMVIAYILTICHMYGRRCKVEQDIALRKNRLKIVKSLGKFIGIFVLCWAPFNLNYLVSFFGVYQFDTRDGSIFFRQVNKIVLLPITMVPIFNAVTFALSSRDIRRAATFRKNSNERGNNTAFSIRLSALR